MNLKEIVHRNKQLPVDETEMIFVIQEYIKIKKGINVNILTTKTLWL